MSKCYEVAQETVKVHVYNVIPNLRIEKLGEVTLLRLKSQRQI